MTKPTNSSGDKVPGISIGKVLFSFLAVLGAWWLFGICLPECLEVTESERGQFGDQFGGANALFSGLAFAGLLWAIWQQHIEIRQAKDQTQIMRDELEALKGEQEKNQKLSALQIQATCYSTMLEAHIAARTGPRDGHAKSFSSPIDVDELARSLEDIAHISDLVVTLPKHPHS